MGSVFPTPTPGAANTTRPRAAPGAPAVVITPDSGLFAGPVTVHLEAPLAGSAVYYTLDGADPRVDGQAYIAPLEVTRDDGTTGSGAARWCAGEHRDHGDVPGG